MVALSKTSSCLLVIYFYATSTLFLDILIVIHSIKLRPGSFFLSITEILAKSS